MRVAVVQLSSTLDTERNLRVAERLLEGAARAGAELVALPEVFNRRGESGQVRSHAETLEGLTMQWAAAQARRHSLWLLAGSFAEAPPSPREGGGGGWGNEAPPSPREGRCHNTSTLYSPEGRRVALYRKIHLFDTDLPGARARESDSVIPGDRLVVSPLVCGGEEWTLGMTVCYDLRFPELYRQLTLQGARLIAVPSAFTERTGRDHWELLLRARAVENQVFIVAPNQYGSTPGTPSSYGRSMIVDPWGTVLAQAPDRESFVVADLDFGYQEEVRQRLPCLSHRRPDLY